MSTVTRITKVTAGHVAMVDAAGLAVAKGSTFVDMAGTPAEALAAWNDAKATVVNTRGEGNTHGTVRRKLETLVAAFVPVAEVVELRPAKARKPRAAKAGNTDAAPAEAPAATTNPGRAGKGLKEQTLAWHMANPTTPAKAEELKVIFGAKWAGPIRIHQRNYVEAGHLVRVGDSKPETYVFKAGSESTETE